MSPIKVTRGPGKINQIIEVRQHRLLADVDTISGGEDSGPNPHEYLAAALGTCTAMTMQMYAQRKQWTLENTEVVVNIIETDGTTTFKRQINIIGILDETQRAKLLEIADKCPIHKALSNQIKIETESVTSF